MILDVHCHTVEDFKPDSIINADLYSFNPREGQYYSIGLHPWDINRIDADEAMTIVARNASHPSVVAIGKQVSTFPKEELCISRSTYSCSMSIYQSD